MFSTKPASLVLRLVVAGSAAVLLYGTACAAENTTLPQTTATPALSESPAPAADTDNAAGVENENANDKAPAKLDESGTTSSATTTSSDAGKGQVKQVVPTPAQSPAVVPSPAAEAVAPVRNPIKEELNHPSQTPAPVVQPTSLPQIQVPTRPVPVVIFREAALPIQPTIRTVARSAEVDLAASMPSVPVSNKTPVPAESNGALGGLRAVLLSTLVPPTIMPDLAVAILQSFNLIALVSLLLLGAGYVFSYGLWLRRGGFVNAARSDAPGRGTTSSLFATPHLMGQGSMPPHRPGPLLVVLEINITSVPLFPTLIERRICI
jgi:hypothetical protein